MPYSVYHAMAWVLLLLSISRRGKRTVFTVLGEGNSMHFVIPSNVTFVRRTIQAAEEFAQARGIKAAPKTSVVLRELLINAIFHGNQNVASRKVQGIIEHTGGRQFKIVVEDEGKGFDYASLDTSLPDDPRHIRNRGYVLIRKVSSALEFNECGNRITAVVDESENDFGIRE